VWIVPFSPHKKISDLRNRLFYWRINLPLNAVAHLRKTSIEDYLNPGDRIVLYTTDGIEAENEAHGQYGSLRLQELLAREQCMTMKALLQRIVEDVDRIADGALQFDDIAVLTVHRGDN
jgi:sigma-B regulation protein RsbU (phosphoserine phosphatase)